MNKQSPSRENEEFKNFQRLTKNLLAVPKKEYDKKHEEFGKKNKKERPAK